MLLNLMFKSQNHFETEQNVITNNIQSQLKPTLRAIHEACFYKI